MSHYVLQRDATERQDESLADELDYQNVDQQDDDRRSKYTGIISWVVSGALHATIILLTLTVVMLSQPDEPEAPPVRIVSIPSPPEKQDEKPKLEREILDPKVVLDIETKADVVAPITTLDVPIDVTSREEDNTDKPAKGREEAVADAETGGSGAFMTIGAGGGSAGMFGSRTGGGRRRAAGKGGGSKGSESAVDAALRWFKKHQSANGMWDAEKYFQNCAEDPKCEPGSLMGFNDASIHSAMTGYALLCFLGAGHDHKSLNKYKTTVKKGLDYLISIQKPDGLIGVMNYEHAVATMALAEAYAMTSDPDLKGPAQRGVDMILQRECVDPKAVDKEYAGLGWDYGAPVERNDSSVTGWNVMALKSAYAAGLTIKGGLENSKRWLERTWKANNDGKEGRPDWRKLDIYKDESRFSYNWYPDLVEYDSKRMVHQELAPVGLVCAVFLGHHSGDAMLETLANWVCRHQTPTAFPCNTYYMYYNTMGMYQVGGERWKTWNSKVRDMLIDAQRKGDGCLDGSWNWEGSQFHGSAIGRVLSTAYCCLSLEVYYRYAQVNKPDAPKKNP
ncbi:MAG: prenyltransferase/squalene oxidase repeat-containing protein [Planctomycetota bacterium]